MDAAEISLCKVKGHSIMAWVCVILHAAVDNIVYGQASNTLAVIFFCPLHARIFLGCFQHRQMVLYDQVSCVDYALAELDYKRHRIM